MIGSIFRIGTTSDYPGSVESMTPYIAEHAITAWDGVEVFSCDPATATDYAGAKALVTDPTDIARHMEVALHSCAAYWLDRIRGGKAEQSFSTYQRDLRLALEQDQLAPLSGRTREIWHDGGWRSPLKADEGA